MAHLISRKELADSFGVDERTISRWKGEGMPPPADGSEYDIEPIIKWWGEREIARRLTSSDGAKLDLNAERARHSKEQADKLEMENNLRRTLMADVRHVAQRWAAVGVNIKTRMLAIPTKAAPLVLRCKTIAEVYEVLTKLIHEALDDISGSPPGLLAGNGIVQGDEAAAKTDGKPVGRHEPKAKPGGKRGAG